MTAEEILLKGLKRAVKTDTIIADKNLRLDMPNEMMPGFFPISLRIVIPGFQKNTKN